MFQWVVSGQKKSPKTCFNMQGKFHFKTSIILYFAKVMQTCWWNLMTNSWAMYWFERLELLGRYSLKALMHLENFEGKLILFFGWIFVTKICCYCSVFSKRFGWICSLLLCNGGEKNVEINSMDWIVRPWVWATNFSMCLCLC